VLAHANVVAAEGITEDGDHSPVGQFDDLTQIGGPDTGDARIGAGAGHRADLADLPRLQRITASPTGLWVQRLLPNPPARNRAAPQRHWPSLGNRGIRWWGLQ